MPKQLDFIANMPVVIEGIDGNKFIIAIADGDMINLTELYKAADKPKNKQSYQWLRLKSTMALKEKLMKSVATTSRRSVLSMRAGGIGGGGSTHAHWQLALSYASYLSPEIHLQINEVFKERLEELVDPELSHTRGTQRAKDGWKRQGKTDKWVTTRLKGINDRNHFTETLAGHGVAGRQFAAISNIENKAVLGCTAQTFKKKSDLCKSAKVRDHVGRTELAGFSLIEASSSEQIEDENSTTAKECTSIVTNTSDVVAETMNKLKLLRA
jgi:hypothetical protein